MAGLLGLNAAAGEAQAHRYNAQVKERNAVAFDYEADWAKIVGDIETQDFIDDTEKFNARIGASIRSNGWTMTGTALDAYMESITEQEEDVARLNMGVIAKQRAIREQGINARMGADLDRMYARNAVTAGKYRAGQTLMDWGFKAGSLLYGA